MITGDGENVNAFVAERSARTKDFIRETGAQALFEKMQARLFNQRAFGPPAHGAGTLYL